MGRNDYLVRSSNIQQFNFWTKMYESSALSAWYTITGLAMFTVVADPCERWLWPGALLLDPLLFCIFVIFLNFKNTFLK